MNKMIRVSDFGTSLRNRNKEQTDGTCTGEEFRAKYLKALDSEEWWKGEDTITLDFEKVDTLGPSWANEVFAYFTQIEGVSTDLIFKKIVLKNITDIKRETIHEEVKDGYRGTQWF